MTESYDEKPLFEASDAKPRRGLPLDKWQLLFLVLLAVCGSLLLYKLSYMNIIWDETPHLYGAVLLSQGRLSAYFKQTIYPPLFDVITAGFFKVFGASAFVGRAVSVIFALLTLVVLFKLAAKTYGRRVAFLSCLFMATMPGFLWLARVSLLEIALEFFFVAALLLFVYWLHSGKNTLILVCGLVVGLAFLVKYQGLVAGLVIVACLPFLFYNSGFKAKISKFPLLILSIAAIVVPVLYLLYYSGGTGQWLSLLQQNSPQAISYSTRFPLPIFYLIEMTYPLNLVHPISILVFILGLHGLGLFLWRRKPEDKMFLVWFLVVYVFFTLIASKDWRYVMPLFPVVAVSAASFVSFLYDKGEAKWKSAHSSLDAKHMAKVFAVCLIFFTAVAVVYSTTDAYHWIASDSVTLPLPQAVNYVSNGLTGNETVMVVCPVNVIYQNIVNFYLVADEAKNNQACQYPIAPVDSYTPTFNVAELLSMCQQNNTKYLLLYEYNDWPYFNTTLTAPTVYNMLLQSGEFTYQATFGTSPGRIYVFEVNATSD